MQESLCFKQDVPFNEHLTKTNAKKVSKLFESNEYSRSTEVCEF